MSEDLPTNDLAARLTNVDLNLLPALVALLQERSVTRAATRIGLSQPAMSHSLARLRVLLRDDLLIRRGADSSLTPRGRLLLGVAPTLLDSISQQVLGLPAFNARHDVRRFTLAMTPSTAYVLSPLLLQIVAEEAPEVSFEIVDAPTPGADIFQLPELDLAIIADTVSTPYERSTLYRDRWVGVVSRDNAMVGEQLTMEDLARLGHVAYDSPTLRLQPYIALAAAGVTPRRELVSSNFLLIPMLIPGTDRIAIAQERLVQTLSANLPLRSLELPFVVPPLGIDVVWNPRLAGDAATSWLVGALHARLDMHRTNGAHTAHLFD